MSGEQGPESHLATATRITQALNAKRVPIFAFFASVGLAPVEFAQVQIILRVVEHQHLATHDTGHTAQRAQENEAMK